LPARGGLETQSAADDAHEIQFIPANHRRDQIFPPDMPGESSE
jgi:hypothetical protein